MKDNDSVFNALMGFILILLGTLIPAYLFIKFVEIIIGLFFH